jgi:hypothetical protein
MDSSWLDTLEIAHIPVTFGQHILGEIGHGTAVLTRSCPNIENSLWVSKLSLTQAAIKN